MATSVILYLNWPERCFRVNGDDLAFLKSLLPCGTKIVDAKSEGEFVAALPGATHVITWHFKSEWYALAPKLRLVASPAAGRELVALPPDASSSSTASSRSRRKLPVVHFGGFHGRIISEAVLAFVLAWTHGFFHIRSMPLWPRSGLADVVDRDLAGSRAVILGFGRIGHAIAERLAAHGVAVRGFSHAECDALKGGRGTGGVRLAGLESELASADWLVAALPSDTGTDYFVDAPLLAKLPRRCVFINVGRGNCVDETALLAALRGGRIAGAYLDVFKHEPTVLAGRSKRPGRGETDLATLSAGRCPWNLIRMPHASAYSPSYMKSAFQELKDEGHI